MTHRPLRLLHARARLSLCVLLSIAPALVAAQSQDADPAAVGSSGGLAAAAASAALSAANAAQEPTPPTSPLAIHVGDADLLIGGFMDMTGGLPIDEHRQRARHQLFQFSVHHDGDGSAQSNREPGRDAVLRSELARLTLQATSKVGSASVKGYVEADFLGNTAQNLNVTSNSDGLRMRLYWAQVQTGKFEFLAGQSWSFMTPNRNGLSPMPADLFYSQDMDTNYQLGLPWGRTPGFRFIAHASDTVALGVALENPQQYVGGAVVLPKAFHGG